MIVSLRLNNYILSNLYFLLEKYLKILLYTQKAEKILKLVVKIKKI